MTGPLRGAGRGRRTPTQAIRPTAAWGRQRIRPFHGGEVMLVLTRRVGETIVIDGTIRVTVVAVGGANVRLGVKAPPLVPVDRAEVHGRRAVCFHGPQPSVSTSPEGESSMQTAQPGDR